MSATGRGAERVAFDFYSTPSWPTEWLLDAVEFPRTTWIEPACGEGAILEVLQQRNVCEVINASDIRPECQDYAARYGAFWLPGPLENLPKNAQWTVSITNPPYNQALEFAKWGVEHCRYTVLLLRLNFLASQKRSEWLSTHVPDVYVLSDRPSFVKSVKCTQKICDFSLLIALNETFAIPCPKCGAKVRITSSDATEYAWMVWHQGPRARGHVQILLSEPPISRVLYT